MGLGRASLLNVLFVSVEVSPFAKVGGLADVAGSLPKALAARGHQVTVAMPAYGLVLEDPRWEIKPVLEKLPVQINPFWSESAWVKETWMGDVRVLLIGGGGFFEDARTNDAIYTPGIEQYLFFTNAVLAASEALELNPHVVHVNDWHTGFIPVTMREKANWDSVGAVFSIHNLAYQGEFGFEVIDLAGLPHSLYNMHQLETWGRVNFLKSGCVFSDQVNTVSPNYAREIQTPEYGCKLEGLMRHLSEAGVLHGILNGIDTEVFDPSSDPALAANYTVKDLSGKAKCKAALRKELGLDDLDDAPVFGVVSRLSSQKGLDHVVEIASQLPILNAQLVVQGLGDPWLADHLRKLSSKFPGMIQFVERFDADLAQRIYAGSDIFLMPSAFEPCGLGQLIAMRYGTVPVVRRTGGLADTVCDGENGFVFSEGNAAELLKTVVRAVKTYSNPKKWQKLMLAGMKGDYTWTTSAAEYEELYRRAITARKGALSAAAS